ncbi:MAG: aminotransferase class III-fold pyridoxal phosphate-dependent enzyme [Chloroflexota bacterium]
MSILAYAPQFTVDDAARFAHDVYDLTATAVSLPSDRDQNFRLTAADRRQFVLKIANSREDPVMLEAQQSALLVVGEGNGRYPHIIPTVNGRLHTTVAAADGTAYLLWLITHLPGIPLARARRHTPALLADFGRTLGELDRALAGFDHPALHRHFSWDLANGLAVIAENLPLVSDTALRQQIGRFADAFAQRTQPLLADLRRSIIHNDANDYNILVDADTALGTRPQRVTGIIDFGDMLYSYTISDLAVACAYVLLDKPDPLAAAAAMVAGYHGVYPLQETELAVLHDLICLRLAISACMAAQQQRQRPDDPYLTISQEPIRRTLPRLLQTPHRLATAVYRHACHLPPVPHASPIIAWLQTRHGQFASVLPVDWQQAHVLDLSVSSPLIHGDARRNVAAALAPRLAAALAAVGATVGIGQYGEARLPSTLALGAGPMAERPTLHLGIDLFAAAETAVCAPLAGHVHACAATANGGPTIVLRHETDNGDPFFTLYRHLSRQSLDGVQVGQMVAAGQPFAALGHADVNGGWPPHLHLQILSDDLDFGADFPDMAAASQWAVWQALSPDPNLILNIPAARFPASAPDKAQTLADRRRRLGGNLSIAYRDPVKIVRGWMQYLYDENGRCYLDAYNNVPHVGHCHPQVVAAAQAQMGVLNTNTRYLHDLLNEYAARLSATLPAPLTVCYFLNSASEANELALRLARAYTGQRDMIVLEAAYHGHTTGLIDISPYKHDGPGGKGAPPWVHTAPIPDVYRGAYKADNPQAGAQYAQHVAAIIAGLQARGVGLAGFIAESLPSVGGQIVPPPGYLAAVYAAVRAAGGVCIADEVQTGYGRIGTHFYGFQAQGVVPDIVVLGKPIGNGHPIAAVVTTPDIAAVLLTMAWSSSALLAAIRCRVPSGWRCWMCCKRRIYRRRALTVGERLLAGLRPLLDRYALVGDVRGSGHFWGWSWCATAIPWNRQAQRPLLSPTACASWAFCWAPMARITTSLKFGRRCPSTWLTLIFWWRRWMRY